MQPVPRINKNGTAVPALLSLIAGIGAAQTVPATLEPAQGETLVLRAHGVGDQVYVCKAGENGSFAWTLKAPDARLLGQDGAVVGRHFAGPTWESRDGSSVTGKVAASVPSPDAQSVPWLLLHATGHQGDGVMSSVTTIQRLNTKGGNAPATGCDADHANTEMRVAYEADYRFYGKR